MKNNLKSTSPGKLIITGEHSVVYGEPAFISAIDLYTTTEILGSRQDVRIQATNIGIDEIFEVDELRDYWRQALSAWSFFSQTGDTEELRIFQNDSLVVVKCSLGMIFEELGVCGGMDIKIASEIPVGCGLGSSASVASSVLGSLMNFYNIRFTVDELNEKTYLIEKIVHGNPSGGDNTAVVYGGGLEFQKRDENSHFSVVDLRKTKGCFALINSGRPKETTGEMVFLVADYVEKNGKTSIKQLGRVSREIISNFKNGVFEKNLIYENQRLLENIGVVGGVAKSIVRKIEKGGGAAKVCGAGGKKKGSGIVLVFHKNFDQLHSLLNTFDMPIYKIAFGVGGWVGGSF